LVLCGSGSIKQPQRINALLNRGFTMISMWKKKLKVFLKYEKAIEGFDPFLCIVDQIFKREVERSIVISGFQVYVRTNTPDLNVAISSLYDKEYDYIGYLNPKVIIDAGANIGTSSIYFATRYPNAKVFAIEPEENNFTLLTKNTNRYANIIAIKAAIWGSIEKRTIQNRFTGHWGYTISCVTENSELHVFQGCDG
jgi:hypothetical protein